MAPQEIKIYNGISTIKVRPYIDNVMQCYNCYRYGHTFKYCKRGPVCVACAEEFHGHCNKKFVLTAEVNISPRVKTVRCINTIES